MTMRRWLVLIFIVCTIFTDNVLAQTTSNFSTNAESWTASDVNLSSAAYSDSQHNWW